MIYMRMIVSPPNISATSMPLAGLHVAKITSATASQPYPLTHPCTHTPFVVTILMYIPPIPQIPPPTIVAIYLYFVILIPAASAVAGSSPIARRFRPTRDLLKNHAITTARMIAKYTSQLYWNNNFPKTGISDKTGIWSFENASFVTPLTVTYPPAF